MARPSTFELARDIRTAPAAAPQLADCALQPPLELLAAEGVVQAQQPSQVRHRREVVEGGPPTCWVGESGVRSAGNSSSKALSSRIIASNSPSEMVGASTRGSASGVVQLLGQRGVPLARRGVSGRQLHTPAFAASSAPHSERSSAPAPAPGAHAAHPGQGRDADLQPTSCSATIEAAVRTVRSAFRASASLTSGQPAARRDQQSARDVRLQAQVADRADHSAGDLVGCEHPVGRQRAHPDPVTLLEHRGDRVPVLAGQLVDIDEDPLCAGTVEQG